ncbi:PEP-CTERM sorting domain-containing protein [Marinobacter caseinilyticus]|uniref:PEP-CTERM sorting domain-containing protein n=1 Tax=Marinobacter caseinilyticus TaxID=2692195 RepID=UPI001407A3F7|nr:PEP-CTERM sorting domain-containing protein [Marinobacter caseinilyticus]
MKKTLLSLCALALMGASSLSHGYILNDNTDVGDLDVVLSITSTLVNSSPITETTWVNSVLGGNLQYAVKDESVNLLATDVADVFAFSLSEKPEYYLVKNAKAWALMSNTASQDWGVFLLSDLAPLFDKNSDNSLDGWTISHVTQFDSQLPPPPVDVPEPNSSMMLAGGLLGLYLLRRRLRKQTAA